MTVSFKNSFTKENIKTYSLLVAGCFIFALGAVLLIEPYGFAPGGTYGLSMVAHHLWGWRTESTALFMDIPLLVLGIMVIGRKFGIKTMLCTLLIPLFMWMLHQTYGYDSIIERGISDMNRMQHQLLAAIFGGLVYGIGLGMIFKSRATSGGSDIISMIVNKYFHISMGTAVTIVDGLITLTTVIAFGDWKLPMYSWIIIFIESKMIDLIIQGQPVKTVMIISDEYEKIKPVILNEIRRGATIIPATGMYKGQEKKLIYTTMTRREMMTLRYRIAEIDPVAFINIIDSSDILGKGFGNIKE